MMQLGISELAWSNENNLDSLLQLLSEHNISFIETVIPKHVDWNNINLRKIKDLIKLYNSYNIQVLSTQSILYNSNIESFYDSKFIEHIKLVSDICCDLNIPSIVLGAPALRNKNFNIDKLKNIFQQLDTILDMRNQVLLIEPNCKQYNGKYFFTVDEIVNFINYSKVSNIKTMIDTHNILNEGSDPADIFSKYSTSIKHVHVSENNLASFINSEYHNKLSNTLNTMKYSGHIIYETKHINFEDIKLFSYIYNK
jgi:sugar phosphate isomerase/epimerase